MVKHDFFLSHFQTDTGAEASLIAQALRNRGFSAFLDIEARQVGNVGEITTKALSESRAVLLLIGPNFSLRLSESKGWVERELDAARESQKPIVPILVRGIDLERTVLPANFEWLAQLRAYTFDRSRTDSLVAELLESLNIRRPVRFLRLASWVGLILALISLMAFAISLYVEKGRQLSDLQEELRYQSAKCDSMLGDLEKKNAEKLRNADSNFSLQLGRCYSSRGSK